VKLYLLKLLSKKLENHSFIKIATRVANNTIKITFDKTNTYYFNLDKSNSFVYKRDNEVISKKFNAPFDIMLHKNISGANIEKVEVFENDRVLKIYFMKEFSYKKIHNVLQLEFTGKNTNAIILDENELIVEALRHIDKSSSFRAVKIGQKLKDLKPFEFTEKEELIEDLDKYFYQAYDNRFKKELEYKKQQSINKINKKIKKTTIFLDELDEIIHKIKEDSGLYDKANLCLRYINEIDIYKRKNIIENNEIIIDGNYSSSSEFVNHLFTKAKRSKAKAKNSVLQKNNLEEKLKFFDKQKRLIENTTSMDKYSMYIPIKKQSKKYPHEVFLYEGFRISVGKNSSENISILKASKKNDYWFHLKDKPSSHVVIHIDKKKPKEDILIKASKYCVDFSANSNGKYLVDWTLRKNVKIIKGSKVSYDNYQTLVILKEDCLED